MWLSNQAGACLKASYLLASCHSAGRHYEHYRGGGIIIIHTHLCTFKNYANAQPGKTYGGMNVLGVTNHLLTVFNASSTS